MVSLGSYLCSCVLHKALGLPLNRTSPIFNVAVWPLRPIRVNTQSSHWSNSSRFPEFSRSKSSSRLQVRLSQRHVPLNTLPFFLCDCLDRPCLTSTTGIGCSLFSPLWTSMFVPILGKITIGRTAELILSENSGARQTSKSSLTAGCPSSSVPSRIAPSATPNWTT